MANRLKVTLIRSGIGRPQRQKDILRGLGLTKLNRSKVLQDTGPVRGMIRKVHHLVSVEAAD